MTRDAMQAFESLRDALKEQLAELPEYRALLAIEASIREIRGLPGFECGATPIPARAEAIRKTMSGGSVESLPVAQGSGSQREQNPLALAIARSVEGNMVSARGQRGVDGSH